MVPLVTNVLSPVVRLLPVVIFLTAAICRFRPKKTRAGTVTIRHRRVRVLLLLMPSPVTPVWFVKDLVSLLITGPTTW